jgi:hypothetical protein
VVAEVFLAPGVGVEAVRGAEVGWNREAKGVEAKGLKNKGLEIPSPYWVPTLGGEYSSITSKFHRHACYQISRVRNLQIES